MTTAFEALLPLASRGITLELHALRAALGAYDHPERKTPSVHVAGTNGKGSVCAMVHASLRAAGVSTGMYTSPHLHRFIERFVIDDGPADSSRAAAFAGEIADGIEAGRLPALSFFEASTLLAWRLFAAAGVSLAVLEVGVGGRLDATNLCAPAVTAITRIALDHQAILGSTLAQIAAAKAGIIKPGVPCVVGPSLRSGEAREVIAREALDVGAPLIEAPEARVLGLDAQGRADLAFEWDGRSVRARLGLPGRHQAGNAAVALGVLECLSRRGVAIDEDAVKTGLSTVTWPARMEHLGRVLIDGAHNPDGLRALCDSLDASRDTLRVGALVFGASSDKPWASMLTEIVEKTGVSAERRFFGAAPLARAVDPREIAAEVSGVACASPAEALERALEALGEGETALACGSLYFVARVRAAHLKLDEDPAIAM